MFSGIIEHIAPIIALEDGYFTVKNMFTETLKEGQSIAHDGVCMTLTAITHDTYTFFAMKETLRVTNFCSKKV
jgi:riboflavin synthase